VAKVTSRLQLTIPKTIAVEYNIRPGDEVDFEAAGGIIRMVPPRRQMRTDRNNSLGERLKLFDRATKRQQRREGARNLMGKAPRKQSVARGWKREDLYTRGRPH